MNDRIVSPVGMKTDRVKPNDSKKMSGPVQLAHHKFHMQDPGNSP